MSIYLDIFIAFFTIGLVGFGGGYAMIPVIQKEVEAHGWLSSARFEDIVSVSAMAPGPFVANSAAMVGYETSRIPGAIVACTAVILPSLLLIILAGRLLRKFQGHPLAISAFNGLRPVIVGIIVFAAYKYALGSGIIGGEQMVNIKSFAIMTAAFVLLLKTRVHPLVIILVSGAAGVFLFK